MVNEISLDYFQQPPERKYHVYRISGSDISETAHSHSFYQICYVDRGEIQHWTDDTFVTSHLGDAFIVPPSFVHRIVFPNRDSQLYSLSFDETMFHPGFPHSAAYRFLSALKLNAAEPIKSSIRMKVTLNQDQRFMIHSLLESLQRESKSDYPPELSCSASLIAAILCILSQAYFMDTQRQEEYDLISHYSQSLKECVEYIDTHFSQPLTLEFLASRYALSKSTFSLLFPQFVGMTLKHYINKKRIEHAALLVQNTDLPLTEVARMTGYEEFSTFYRNFKRITGVAPSAYRSCKDTSHS